MAEAQTGTQDKQLRRAGLDYHEWANVKTHENYSSFLEEVKPKRLFAFSTHGKHSYTDARFQKDDVFIFGPETKGLPKSLRESLPEENVLRIPMLEHSRSLNLSNSAAVVLFEAWRQLDFFGS